MASSNSEENPLKKEGTLLMSRESVMSKLPFMDSDFAMEWEPCWLRLTAHSITFIEEAGGDGNGGSIPLKDIVAIQPEEFEDITCLSLKVEEIGDEEETVHRIRSAEGAVENDLQQWKIAILMGIESARDEERLRNGQVVRGSPSRPSSPSGPNTHPKSAEKKERGGEAMGSLKMLEEKEEKKDTAGEESSTLKEASEKAPDMDRMINLESELISLKKSYQLSEERLAVLLKEQASYKEATEGASIQHLEALKQAEATREEEVASWCGKYEAMEADSNLWKAKAEAESSSSVEGKGKAGELEQKVLELEGEVQKQEKEAEELNLEHGEMVAKLESMREEEVTRLEGELEEMKKRVEDKAGENNGNAEWEAKYSSLLEQQKKIEADWEAKTAGVLEQQKTALKEAMELKLKGAELKAEEVLATRLEESKAANQQDIQWLEARLQESNELVTSQAEEIEALKGDDNPILLGLTAQVKNLTEEKLALEAEKKELEDMLLADEGGD